MRPLPAPASRSARLAAATLAGALALGLGACSGGGGDDGAGGASGVSSAQTAPEELGAPDTADSSDAARAGTTGGGAGGTAAVVAAVAERKISRRADVSLRVDDVARAAARLRGIAAAAGGLVVAEQISSDGGVPEPLTDEDAGGLSRPVPPPGAWGTVTISVPTERLDATLDSVAELGTVQSRRTSTDDVTGQYVDTTSRIRTMKASVDRVRALMTRAEQLSDIVTLEAELSRRQADLEALEQQLASLDDRVALAPISVQLSSPTTPPAVEDPTGFLAGLASGWAAFTTSVRLLLTLVGALVPFALAALVVLGPLAWWWRRRPRAAAATPPGATPAG